MEDSSTQAETAGMHDQGKVSKASQNLRMLVISSRYEWSSSESLTEVLNAVSASTKT